MQNKKLIVIGGGPAGMLAAGTAASRGLDVMLIEKNKRLGKKLLITGKGRCNITNNTDIQGFIDNIPVNGNFLYSVFYTFSNTDLVNLLESLGLQTKVERGGRIFPQSDKAIDVLKTLEKYLEMNKVQVMKQEQVQKLITDGTKVLGVRTKSNKDYSCDCVIVATGGISYPRTGSTGDGYQFAKQIKHHITPLKPSLVPLEIQETWIKKLMGLSLRNVAITVLDSRNRKIYHDFGEMLFTHYGVSGPLILSASSHLKNIHNEKYQLVIDLKPALSEEQLDKRIQRDFEKYSRKNFNNSLNDLLPQKLIPVIIKQLDIPHEIPVHQITKVQRQSLVRILKRFTLNISGFRPISEAIVTSGGVNVDEINPGTMESKLIKDLFFAGEILDVDGYTGGFNLQIAFSTGYTAGLNC